VAPRSSSIRSALPPGHPPGRFAHSANVTRRERVETLRQVKPFCASRNSSFPWVAKRPVAPQGTLRSRLYRRGWTHRSYELARYMGTSVEMIERTYGHLVTRADDAFRSRLDSYGKLAEVIDPGRHQ
jgi:hypothetical protein